MRRLTKLTAVVILAVTIMFAVGTAGAVENHRSQLTQEESAAPECPF